MSVDSPYGGLYNNREVNTSQTSYFSMLIIDNTIEPDPLDIAKDASEDHHHSGAQNASASWTAIEDHIYQNDSSMIKHFSDDIDTLLVFVSKL